jgi:exopolysaccharide biosynthesis WecB/TagA/CpsF family protein
MEKKIKFSEKNKKEIKEIIFKKKESKIIFNFLNLYSLYLYKHNKLFQKAIDNRKEDSITLVDGFTISFFLRLKRLRGTDFTLFILNNKEISKGKKHLFIGIDEKNKENNYKILKKFGHLEKNKIFFYNPPYIKNFVFSKEEIEKIANLINSKKIDFIWVGVGNPKQEILSDELYKKIKKGIFFNIGAALDFITGNKKEAPIIFRKIGLEWFYRLITDFNHSKKKVLGSLVGFFYIFSIIKIKE